MLDSILRRTGRLSYDWLCRGILRTAPLRQRPAPVRIVSMVAAEHILMYLVAIKTFYRQLPGGSITVLDDGSLTERHHATLRHHLGEIEIVAIGDVDTGPCPRGGCWERLLLVLDRVPGTYVVQLDSDMLTTAAIPEVVAAIRDNRAFTLKGGPTQAIVGLEAAATQVAGFNGEFMQVRAERALPGLEPGLGDRYVRGSAGFAGFARGGPARAVAERFSSAMQRMVGSSWSEWGSEQVTSNFVVANSPDAIALPWPKYCCFFPKVEVADAAMIHFIGTWRFQRGVYLRKSRAAIAQLLSEGSGAGASGSVAAAR